MTQTAHETQVLDWLAGQKAAMLALLQEVVDTDSGSYDKAGVDAVGARFIRFFAEHGLPTTVEANATYGDAIHVRLDDVVRNDKPVLLMGHRDTVFPKGEAGRRPFRIEAGRAYGPGVADMKAGLVMNAFVLAAMKKFGAPVPVIGLITSDEEIASPSSRPIIERVARDCRAVLNAEPGRPSGNIVTGRKGGVFMAFEVTGKAAHSGGNFEKGISAVGELAHKVVALHALTGLRPGITVNVGLVKGGQSVNTTAPSAEGQIDLRYVRREDRAVALAEVERIIATSTVKGATASLTIRGEFLPLDAGEAAADLFATYTDAAAAAGLKVEGEFTGGCADSGFTAAVGCPTLCATGPVGANAHTPEEVLEVESMVPRAQAAALTILRLPPQG
ncbi:MAG: M20 family metallopeptidase [Hyphomicrobiaceae bacterium]|nr:M20 family metallopeptidase [Hyphomicrobiaceae bacterium]